MNRKDRIYHDRAEMARKALVQAGYLTEDQELDEAIISDATSNFLADLFHLLARFGTINANYCYNIQQEALRHYIEIDRGKMS